MRKCNCVVIIRHVLTATNGIMKIQILMDFAF